MISIPGFQILEQLKRKFKLCNLERIRSNKWSVIGKVLKWESIIQKKKHLYEMNLKF